MDRLDAIVAASRARGLNPWLGLKSELAAAVVNAMRAVDGQAVLQGGAAVHFAYGSLRLSVDVDYAGTGSPLALEDAGPTVAAAVAEAVGRDVSWRFKREGKLGRGKVGVTMDGARSLVLPVEACDVPAHRVIRHSVTGLVEAADEIVADKLVATALRLRESGSFKLTDVFDIWYLMDADFSKAPEKELVAEKLADYGAAPAGTDVSRAIRSIEPEELASVLKVVLPARDYARFDASGMISRAAALAAEYDDVL